jgi:hypothetical protein
MHANFVPSWMSKLAAVWYANEVSFPTGGMVRRDRRTGFDLQSGFHLELLLPLLPGHQELLLSDTGRPAGSFVGLLPGLPVRLFGLSGIHSTIDPHAPVIIRIKSQSLRVAYLVLRALPAMSTNQLRRCPRYDFDSVGGAVLALVHHLRTVFVAHQNSPPETGRTRRS